MTTEYNISSGPVADDDDALPTSESLTAALNNIINPGASAPTTGQPAKESTTTPTPEANDEPAPLVLKRGTTPAQIKAYIEKLESDPAWANANDPNHAEVHRHLRASYQALANIGPEAPAPAAPKSSWQVRVEASRATTERRITELQNSKEWAKGDPAVLAELKGLYQKLDPSPAMDPADLPHISDLRRETGTEGPRALPSHYAENWNTDVEAEYLAIGSKAGIKGEALQAALNWYVSTGTLSGRFEHGFTKADEASFIEAAPTLGLTEQQARGIISWYRSVQKESQS